MKTTRVQAGHYQFSYRGHLVEVIDMRLLGGDACEWIATIDGACDQEALPTKREATAQAILNINAER